MEPTADKPVQGMLQDTNTPLPEDGARRVWLGHNPSQGQDDSMPSCSAATSDAVDTTKHPRPTRSSVQSIKPQRWPAKPTSPKAKKPKSRSSKKQKAPVSATESEWRAPLEATGDTRDQYTRDSAVEHQSAQGRDNREAPPAPPSSSASTTLPITNEPGPSPTTKAPRSSARTNVTIAPSTQDTVHDTPQQAVSTVNSPSPPVIQISYADVMSFVARRFVEDKPLISSPPSPLRPSTSPTIGTQPDPTHARTTRKVTFGHSRKGKSSSLSSITLNSESKEPNADTSVEPPRKKIRRAQSKEPQPDKSLRRSTPTNNSNTGDQYSTHSSPPNSRPGSHITRRTMSTRNTATTEPRPSPSTVSRLKKPIIFRAGPFVRSASVERDGDNPLSGFHTLLAASKMLDVECVDHMNRLDDPTYFIDNISD
jgi:hypothetical protein